MVPALKLIETFADCLLATFFSLFEFEPLKCSRAMIKKQFTICRRVQIVIPVDIQNTKPVARVEQKANNRVV